MKKLLSLTLLILVLAGCSIDIKEVDGNEEEEGFSFERIDENKDTENE
ncbi:lipoprotein [Terribacillus saccharophilus]|nr:lipoprotein [Terribacillus saccharophilus]MCM3227268.1 lipoprotein [Terribacillus saccharophilus]